MEWNGMRGGQTEEIDPNSVKKNKNYGRRHRQSPASPSLSPLSNFSKKSNYDYVGLLNSSLPSGTMTIQPVHPTSHLTSGPPVLISLRTPVDPPVLFPLAVTGSWERVWECLLDLVIKSPAARTATQLDCN